MFSKIKDLFSKPKVILKEDHEAEINRVYDRALTHATRMFSHYDAGNTGRLEDDWKTSNNTPTQNLKGELRNIIARSVASVDNNAHTVGLLKTLLDNTIGTGMRPRPRVKHSNGDLVAGINAILAEKWKRYNDEWDAKGRDSFLEAQRTIFAGIFRSGSTILNKVNAPPGNLIPIQTQIANVLRLDSSKDQQTPTYGIPDSAQTVFGINLNSSGKALSYWVQGINSPVSRDNMKLCYKTVQEEQYIGIPALVSALNYLWGNKNLIKDKLIASKIQAMITLWMPDSVMSSAIKNKNGDNQVEWQSGHVWYGQPNEKPEVLQADDSIQAVLEPLQRLLLHAISMTQGVSYQTMTRDLVKTNMASARINVNQDRKSYTAMQKWFSKEVCKYVWDDFVFYLVLQGEIPGLDLTTYLKNPWKYNEVQWMTPGFDFIDPSKEGLTAIELIKNNMMTFEKWYGDQGVQYEDAFEQISKEKVLMKKLKIEVEDVVKQKARVTNDSEDEE